MLGVTALQLRDPVVFLVLMESGDSALHPEPSAISE
jgi:hypothetical protein